MDIAAKKNRLLLIEDNVDTRQIYKDVFEREGFQVLLAEDGEKGLSYAQATIPDVILLDLMLPKISGFDVLQRLRADEDTKNIPVAIFSALGEAADRRKAVQLGVTDYSVKALNSPKHVVGLVRGLLARAEQASASGAAPVSMSAALKDAAFDSARLQSHAGLKGGFLCPQCHAEVVLSMIPDPTRAPGHWFAARLACSSCPLTF